MKALLIKLVLISALTSFSAVAEQSKEFGEYTVHYNALSASLLTPEIAKAYGIRRSASRALINVSVLKKIEGHTASAVEAKVVASGRNLTGQIRNVDMRQIKEGDDAIYYIGELSVRNMETFDFTLMVTPDGQNKPFRVKFRQQFYTE